MECETKDTERSGCSRTKRTVEDGEMSGRYVFIELMTYTYTFIFSLCMYVCEEKNQNAPAQAIASLQYLPLRLLDHATITFSTRRSHFALPAAPKCFRKARTVLRNSISSGPFYDHSHSRTPSRHVNNSAQFIQLSFRCLTIFPFPVDRFQAAIAWLVA